MRLSDFDYFLPEELIAVRPSKRRDESRLMTVARNGEISERLFKDIVRLFKQGDILVLNDTKVFPAAVSGTRRTGGAFELLFCERLSGNDPHEEWSGLATNAKRLRVGETITLPSGAYAEIAEALSEGAFKFRFERGFHLLEYLDKHGRTPLPHYIRKQKREDTEPFDRKRYQTIYARETGAVAAPTAGLHFTQKLLDSIPSLGVEIVYITLHVGVGTFMPLRNERLDENRLHSEAYTVSRDTAEKINRAKAGGGRIIAVGTTTVRTLETASDESGTIKPQSGRTDLFIAPGYRFKAVDAMVTNFHLPRSSLLVLVSAFSGKETILSAYKEAVRRRFRFYSYGDAMWLERSDK
ncbi:MAG: tRNA preQ1(34) S-adenosylmethionine ribosyltransferase-isomerase QueA [Myxococcota bacterium]